MKKSLWLMLLVLGATACGGGAADSTAITGLQAAGNDLSGLSLEVHQEPG